MDIGRPGHLTKLLLTRCWRGRIGLTAHDEKQSTAFRTFFLIRPHSGRLSNTSAGVQSMLPDLYGEDYGQGSVAYSSISANVRSAVASTRK